MKVKTNRIPGNRITSRDSAVQLKTIRVGGNLHSENFSFFFVLGEREGGAGLLKVTHWLIGFVLPIDPRVPEFPMYQQEMKPDHWLNNIAENPYLHSLIGF